MEHGISAALAMHPVLQQGHCCQACLHPPRQILQFMRLCGNASDGTELQSLWRSGFASSMHGSRQSRTVCTGPACCADCLVLLATALLQQLPVTGAAQWLSQRMLSATTCTTASHAVLAVPTRTSGQHA
jgi:hypothetical protein